MICFLCMAAWSWGPASGPIEAQGPSGGVVAGFCPGNGDCFTEHSGSGCDDPTCCALVCSREPTCCIFDWEDFCVVEALLGCETSACPASGDCFASHGTPGCDDAACCEAVCDRRPFCCEFDWDTTCVNLAREECGPPRCPAEGNCFAAHSTPGCEAASCCEQVCEEDASCCENTWSEACAVLADRLCSNEVCPSEGPCTQFHLDPGCSDEDCCNRVCALDPKCCSGFRWDRKCFEAARDLCRVRCPQPGNCFGLHDTPGCDDALCCARVCERQPDCCRIEHPWDGDCTSIALQECLPNCPTGLLRAVDPPANVVDAGQPESGIQTLRIRAPSKADRRCFRLCDGMNGNHRNRIVSMVENDGEYTLGLEIPLVPGTGTTLNYESHMGGVEQLFYYATPGDVDGNSGVLANEPTNLLICLTSSEPSAPLFCPWGLFSYDLDRDGHGSLLDLMRLIELLIGWNGFKPQLDAPPSLGVSCP